MLIVHVCSSWKFTFFTYFAVDWMIMKRWCANRLVIYYS